MTSDLGSDGPRELRSARVGSFGRILPALALLALGCRAQVQRPNDSGARVAGEPERYTATVVRFVDDGDPSELEVTRVARSAGMTREEWSESGETRVLIWRPDLGRGFLLALERKIYVEFNLNPGRGNSPPPSAQDENRAPPSETKSNEAREFDRVEPEQIEAQFSYTTPPERLESHSLPDQTINDHPCWVEETRAVFDDGRIEVTRCYRAQDLSGLAVRIESETQRPGGFLRLITERREVLLDAPQSLFEIPPGFRRVRALQEGKAADTEGRGDREIERNNGN